MRPMWVLLLCLGGCLIDNARYQDRLGELNKPVEEDTGPTGDTAVLTGPTGHTSDTGPTSTLPVDADGDGVFSDEDCDDHNEAVHPGAEDAARDGIDNDCDGLVDEEVAFSKVDTLSFDPSWGPWELHSLRLPGDDLDDLVIDIVEPGQMLVFDSTQVLPEVVPVSAVARNLWVDRRVSPPVLYMVDDQHLEDAGRSKVGDSWEVTEGPVADPAGVTVATVPCGGVTALLSTGLDGTLRWYDTSKMLPIATGVVSAVGNGVAVVDRGAESSVVLIPDVGRLMFIDVPTCREGELDFTVSEVFDHNGAALGAEFSVVTGDFDGDGQEDAASVSYAPTKTGALHLWHNEGAVPFVAWSAPDLTAWTGACSASDLVAVDLNGDGPLDLAVACENQGYIGFLINDGQGNFTATTRLLVGATAWRVAALNLNGDDKADLAVTSFYISSLLTFEGL